LPLEVAPLFARILALLVLLAPAAALGAGLVPPLATPPNPATPPSAPSFDPPPVPPLFETPPVLILEHRGARLDWVAELLSARFTPPGPPESHPPVDLGPPDLSGVVDLPSHAQRVHDLAPPFGGVLPAADGLRISITPEPTTAALLLLGLVSLGLRRRS
jgi:hypothetical protein